MNGFDATVGKTGVIEGSGGKTSFTPEADLQPTTVFYWRARAIQAAKNNDGVKNVVDQLRIAPAVHDNGKIDRAQDKTARTADKAGQVIPAQITIFEDRSFTFVLKTPPAPDLLRKAAGVDKGSATPTGRSNILSIASKRRSTRFAAASSMFGLHAVVVYVIDLAGEF